MSEFKETNTIPRNAQLTVMDKVSIGVSEFLGTAILVFVACLGSTTSDMGQFQPSLASGLAVMMVIHIFGHISGAHVNPVTTVCALIMEEIDVWLVPVYICTQICGSVAGFALLKLILPVTFLVDAPGSASIHGPGMTLPVTDDLSTLQVFSIELVVTSILSLANCASWDRRTTTLKDSLALRFGFLVAALNFISVPLTGCSMNPARSFGPALFYNDWTLHWVYWVAPLTASVIASFVYRILLCKKENKNVIFENST